MFETPRTILFILATMFLGGTLAMGDKPSSRSLIPPCPDKPNCVSSLAEDEDRRVAPLTYSGDLDRAREKILGILNGFEKVKIVVVEKDYIHAEFRSSLFRFVDDVQLYFPPDEKIVHVRSASRTGYYDFGVNRRRIDRLREQFEQP
jgi:uncharacterized protein (DUF1499 family)